MPPRRTNARRLGLIALGIAGGLSVALAATAIGAAYPGREAHLQEAADTAAIAGIRVVADAGSVTLADTGERSVAAARHAIPDLGAARPVVAASPDGTMVNVVVVDPVRHIGASATARYVAPSAARPEPSAYRAQFTIDGSDRAPM